LAFAFAFEASRELPSHSRVQQAWSRSCIALAAAVVVVATGRVQWRRVLLPAAEDSVRSQSLW
jgi:steroid 5-alpha reductase family enzyme